MNYTDGNEPAFTGEYKTHNHGIEVTDFYDGLSQRDYACIKLKVPKTNKEWLNEIIVESRRNDLAGQAMQGILNSDHPITMAGDAEYQIAESSYRSADAILKAEK